MITTGAASAKRQRSHNRIKPLLDSAARLFAERGYRETTIRDIGAAIDMLPGSVYYHFDSKQELLLAIYGEGVRTIKEKVRDAVERANNDPWARLETAVITHLETILDQSAYARVMIGITPDKVPDISEDLRALRDEYESSFTELVDALPLPTDFDRKMLRLMLLGAVNGSQLWYRVGQNTPADIGSSFIAYLKHAITEDGYDT